MCAIMFVWRVLGGGARVNIKYSTARMELISHFEEAFPWLPGFKE